MEDEATFYKKLSKSYSRMCTGYVFMVKELKDLILPMTFYRGFLLGSYSDKYFKKLKKEDPKSYREMIEKLSLGKWLYESKPENRTIMYGLWHKGRKRKKRFSK